MGLYPWQLQEIKQPAKFYPVCFIPFKHHKRGFRKCQGLWGWEMYAMIELVAHPVEQPGKRIHYDKDGEEETWSSVMETRRENTHDGQTHR